MIKCSLFVWRWSTMMINQSSEKYMTLLKENCSYSQCQGYITTHWRRKLFLKLFGVSRKFQKIHSLEPAEIVAYTVIINRNVCIDILTKENKHSINVQIDEKQRRYLKTMTTLNSLLLLIWSKSCLIFTVTLLWWNISMALRSRKYQSSCIYLLAE